jgi:hypothetical protein
VPGSWLAATARNECLRAVAARKKIVLADDDAALNDVATHQPEADERLLADERTQTVREALSSLPWQWQRLPELLMADPPASTPRYPTGWASGRQYGPHPRAVPGPTPRTTTGILTGV